MQKTASPIKKQALSTNPFLQRLYQQKAKQLRTREQRKQKVAAMLQQVSTLPKQKGVISQEDKLIYGL